MYDNIGSKIKTLAKIICAIGIIASLVVGAYIADVDSGLGVSIMFLGSLGSWIATFFMYGFGELIYTNGQIINEINRLQSETRIALDNIHSELEDIEQKIDNE